MMMINFYKFKLKVNFAYNRNFFMLNRKAKVLITGISNDFTHLRNTQKKKTQQAYKRDHLAKVKGREKKEA